MPNTRVSASKAKRILDDGKVNGRDLSPKQRRFFGAIASGSIKKAATGAGVRTDDSTNEADTKARRQQEHSVVKTNARQMLVEGLQEGGIMGPPAPEPVAGLEALAEVQRLRGDAGIQAIMLGLASARNLHSQQLNAADAAQSPFPSPDFESILKAEVERAYQAIVNMQRPATSNPTPTPVATGTPTPTAAAR